MKLKDALDAYLVELQENQSSQAHLKTVAWRLGRFIKPRREREVDSVTRAELAQFITKYKENHSDGSMAGMTATHRQFWKFCKKKGWMEQNPAKKLKSYSYAPVLRKPPAEADVERVAAALMAFVEHRDRHPCDVRDALFVSLSLDSGARRGAMLKLRRTDVVRSLAQGRQADNGRMAYLVTISRDKTGASTLEFFEETARLFRLWFELCPVRRGSQDRVFVNSMTGKPLHPNSIAKAFIRICQFAGVPVFRPHGVRKRNGREMIKSSDVETARRYTGHKDVETLITHYNDVEEADVQNAAAALASRRRGDGVFDEGMRRLFNRRGEGE